jgi:hypothetical protein
MNDMISVPQEHAYDRVVSEISQLGFENLSRAGISQVAWAYYFFSIQFRENLQVACRLYPDEPAISRLREEECGTDNLSPWPGVAQPGEKMDHDEFMRRVLLLTPIDQEVQKRIEDAGRAYLERTRAMDDRVRAMSISSYENGGLEAVFTAMLRCQYSDTPLLEAFRHFLVRHIGFDSDPDEGHGALVRHIAPDDRIMPLWAEFRDLLVKSVPGL